MARRITIQPGALGWVNVDTPEVWVHAEVATVQGEKITVVTTKGNRLTVPFSRFRLRNTDDTLDIDNGDASSFHDLSLLPNLSEPEVLVALERRFFQNYIYTFSGTILLAVNPFKVIPRLYDDPRADCGPHVYKVAKDAHRGMCVHKKDQALLISGESGAGKTETTKFVLRYFASLYGRSGDAMVERMVIESNPLLEAFGNAKTLRNDNSSRFGKFIDLKFEEETLLGAAIRTYLLEKVRVCSQSPGERSFHFFYQVCAAYETLSNTDVYTCDLTESPMDWCGTSESRRPSVCGALSVNLSAFGPASSFKYLNIGKLAFYDDIAGFDSTLLALQAMNISMEEISGILATVAGVLRLGNIGVYESSAEASSLTRDEELDKLTQCLGIKRDALERALCLKTLRTTDGLIQTPLDTSKALESRDALARHLYGALFTRICLRINTAFTSLGGAETAANTIGVLDIFGFEFFERNSFEQLCINFTNELLQNFFTTLVFLEEEKLYVAEGIPWDKEDFTSNEGIVFMLNSRPNGVFSMLDEECRVAQGTDAAWASKMLKSWAVDSGKNGVYMAAVKTNREAFVVKHFAGDVEYESAGFLEKNKDDISKELLEVMNESTLPFIRDLFGKDSRSYGVSAATHGGKTKVLKAKQYTVSGEFREQLESLMTSLHEAQPTFVRCIKPNMQNVPDSFDRPNVVEQMRYQGVLQAIAVARAGYPVRWLHDKCVAHLRCLLDSTVRTRVDKIPNPSRQCTLLLETLTTQLSLPASGHSQLRYAVGKTRVFLKQAPYEILESARRTRLRSSAVRIQSHWRRFKARKRYLYVRKCLIAMQSRMRRTLARLKVARLRRRRAAVTVQRRWRGAVQRREFARIKRASIRIQAVVRGTRERKVYVETMGAVVRIQAAMSRVLRRIRARRRQDAATKIARFARVVLAKRERRHRAMERMRLRRALRSMVRKRRKNADKRAERDRLMRMYSRKRGSGHTASQPLAAKTPSVGSTLLALPIPEQSVGDSAPGSVNTREDGAINFVTRPSTAGAMERKSVPDLATINQWSATDIQMFLRDLMDENRCLQERLGRAQEPILEGDQSNRMREEVGGERPVGSNDVKFGCVPRDYFETAQSGHPASGRSCGEEPCVIM